MGTIDVPSPPESPGSATLHGGEYGVLELIATGAPLETSLDALCRFIDEQSGLQSSVFLLDATGEWLTLGAGPHLPESWTARAASFPITQTACGAAVRMRQQTISADISGDPVYAGYHDAADAAGFRAAWSTPFFSKNGQPLGTFAVYNKLPGWPSAENLALVGRATRLASIAVERHLAEQELRESEVRFSRAFNANPACMVVWSFPDGRFQSVNDAFVRMFGYSRDEALGQSAMTLGLYADPQQRPAMIQMLLEGKFTDVEVKGRTKSGAILDLLVSMDRIDESRALAIAIDITDRKRAEEAVRRGERRWRSVFDNSAIGIVIADSALRITAANRAFEELCASTEQALTSLTLLDVTHPDDRHLVQEEIADLLAGRSRERQFEKRHLRRNGEVVWVRCTGSLMHEANESPCFLALLEDITARKTVEQELAQSMNDLRALTAKLLRAQDDERRRIAQLLHETTAQDLAALKMLLGRVNRVRDGVGDTNRDILDESVQLANRAMTQIRTLAYLLHPPFLDEAGLPSAVRWYAQGFAQRSGITVDLNLPAAMDRLSQDVETTLFRVIQEALINIHRHAASPTARIHLRRAADQITLEVEDQGRGMSPDVVARLAGGVGPLGVGIAGMRERLEQLGGKLALESSPGRTIVRAIVPLAKPA